MRSGFARKIKHTDEEQRAAGSQADPTDQVHCIRYSVHVSVRHEADRQTNRQSDKQAGRASELICFLSQDRSSRGHTSIPVR